MSKKLQRIYAYWWPLASCYTDNNDKIIENLVASYADAQYYWRKNGKEIDFLLVDRKKVTPIEVKNKAEITKRELQNMRYLLQKHNIKKGTVVYTGKKEETKSKGKKIKFVPLWKWLLESQPKENS